MPMTPESTSQSGSEILAGLVERVTFHNAESGFCVLRVKARREWEPTFSGLSFR